MIPERTSHSATLVIQADSLIDRSLRLLHKSILFGWKKELYRSAALYNLKSFSPDFSTAIKSISISDTSAKRFVRIGKLLAKIIHSEEENGALFLSEEHLERICSERIKEGERLTLRGLDKASKEFDLFTKYLSGETDEVKLLGTHVSALPAHSDLKEEEEVTKERVIKTARSPYTEDVWDELENLMIEIPGKLAKAIRRVSAASHDKEILLKYRSILQTIERIKAGLGAYHRSETEEAISLLLGAEMEEI